MAERVYLHIGAPKCGTTYLQTLLWTHQEQLAEAGVLVPGQVRFDHNRAAQAVRRGQQADEKALATWRELLREIDEWPGTAVLSNEWFSLTGPKRVARAVARLAPAEVHVVVTARDLVRAVPSAWQETLKLGIVQPLGSFIESLEDSGDRWRWSTLDPATTLERWRDAVPADRIHVVPLPVGRGDPGLLWRRFARACSIPDPDSFDPDAGTSNESISAESARLLARIGPRLREAVDVEHSAWNVPYRWIRNDISHDVLVPHRGSAIALSEHDLAVLRERARHSVESLRNGGYDVVGDLDELVGATVPADALDPADVPDEALLPLAEDVLVALLRRAYAESRRADRAEQRLAEAEEEWSRSGLRRLTSRLPGRRD